MSHKPKPATPNHALQRTAPRVTVAAISSSNPSRPSGALFYARCRLLRSTTQLPRRAPQSLSLGSLGVASRSMKTTLLSLLAFVCLASVRADDPAGLTDNAKLPKCTKVEVILLGGLTKDANPKRAFLVRLDQGWTEVLGTKTVEGEAAEAFASNWRALAPDPTRGVFACHVPGYAYRFYDGNTLLAESTVCWHCENLAIHIGADKFKERLFDPTAQPAVDLLRRTRQLFNIPQK